MVHNPFVNVTFGSQPSTGNGQPTLFDLVGPVRNDKLRMMTAAYSQNPGPDTALAHYISGWFLREPSSVGAETVLGAIHDAESGSNVTGGASPAKVARDMLADYCDQVVAWVSEADADYASADSAA